MFTLSRYARPSYSSIGTLKRFCSTPGGKSGGSLIRSADHSKFGKLIENKLKEIGGSLDDSPEELRKIVAKAIDQGEIPSIIHLLPTEISMEVLRFYVSGDWRNE